MALNICTLISLIFKGASFPTTPLNYHHASVYGWENETNVGQVEQVEACVEQVEKV